ncbi:hypothetical protein, partial [Microbacterium sp.]|uniref:hypothetical protein n=1 Tax=Microbacterium sp. TaxID=51671 RepID=UPI003C2786ED
HLQLAYASTVHGIQGETMDAAVVGPDVDAPRISLRSSSSLTNSVSVSTATRIMAKARREGRATAGAEVVTYTGHSA